MLMSMKTTVFITSSNFSCSRKMKETSLFKLVIILTVSFVSCNSQYCPCGRNNGVLQCYVSTSAPSVNTNLCESNGYNLIKITYSGNVLLDLVAPLTKPILIEPVDANNHTLQILSINTQAKKIDIIIQLSLNQASSTLFTATSSIIALNTTLIINVVQSISDAKDFKLFDIPSSTNILFASLELTFSSTSTNPGVRKFQITFLY